MPPSIHRVIIYTKKMQEMAEFYAKFFGYKAVVRDGDRIWELRPREGGLTLLLHPASRGQKEGQSLIKLLFDVEDVEACRSELTRRGLEVGPLHDADGYQFANAKDPSKNAISISNRAYAGNH
ncbi:MAG: VOC family protein [Alphaproteobacteria bacterium]